MMKKKLLSVVALGFISILAVAQQDIQFTQFMNNKLFYNPGMAGNSGSICINGAHRSQWVGFDGAPTTQNINAEIPMNILHGGLLLNISNDAIGYYSFITAGIGYALQLDVAGGKLGIGFEVDFRNTNLNQGEWIAPQNQVDIFGKFGTSDMSPDVNFGVYYSKSNFWAGVSSSRLLAAKADLDNVNNPAGVTEFASKRHYFIMGGYDFEVPNTAFTVSPAVLLKTDMAGPLQADINISGWYNKKIMAGVGYRLQDAFSIMAGYQILPQLRASYSYDLTTSTLKTASSGSHEIMINYCFKIEIPPREKDYHRNPRFL